MGRLSRDQNPGGLSKLSTKTWPGKAKPHSEARLWGTLVFLSELPQGTLIHVGSRSQV